MVRASAPPDEGIRITALGTGAAALNNGRASAGYVVHVDDEPTLVVDAGGGTGARLSDARIDLAGIDAVCLGHLHVDHTADFPAIVKAAYQQGRGDRPLSVYGPAGTESLPGTEAWLSRLFDEETGAYGYLAEFVDRYADGTLSFDVTEVDATASEDDEVRRILERDGLTVDAIPVVHGRIPTLAYRVAYGGDSVTFTGDYSATTGNVATIADGTDLLVHNRLLEADADPDAPKAELHPTAAECGENARAADAGALVLSHVSRDDPADLEAELETIREAYDGPVIVARDLVDLHPDGTVVDTHSGSSIESSETDALDDSDVLVLDPATRARRIE